MIPQEQNLALAMNTGFVKKQIDDFSYWTDKSDMMVAAGEVPNFSGDLRLYRDAIFVRLMENEQRRVIRLLCSMLDLEKPPMSRSQTREAARVFRRRAPASLWVEATVRVLGLWDIATDEAEHPLQIAH